jgi:hypothetical protein
MFLSKKYTFLVVCSLLLSLGTASSMKRSAPATKNTPTKKRKITFPIAGLVNGSNYCYANAAIQILACVQNRLHQHCTCNTTIHNQLWAITNQLTQQEDAYDARNFINQTAQELHLPPQYDDSAQFIQQFFQHCAKQNCACLGNILYVSTSKNVYDQGVISIQDTIDQQLYGSLSPIILKTQHQISQIVQNNNQRKQHLIESRYAPILMIECPGNERMKPQEQLVLNCVNQQQKTYTLKGILLYNGGHYIALVKYNQAWFLCNDATITKGGVAFYQLRRGGQKNSFYPRMFLYETNDPTPTQAQIAQWTQAELPQIFGGNQNFVQQFGQSINDEQRLTLVMHYIRELIEHTPGLQQNFIKSLFRQQSPQAFYNYLINQGQMLEFLEADAAGKTNIINAFKATQSSCTLF